MRAPRFLPRPEYPRPDRQRAFVQGVDWINLNGAWEFRFDPDRVGMYNEWFAPSPQQWSGQIIVPFCWESLAAWGQAAAAGNDNYFSTRVYRNPLDITPINYRSAARHEVGWYRREVNIPACEPWRRKRIILTVGAADFSTTAWCNGQFVGAHEGGFTPFEFDLTDSLIRRPGGELSGTVVFRVEDSMNNHDQPVGKQWGWYSSVSGIWQTVFLEPRAHKFVERFEIVPDIKNAEARFKIFVSDGAEVMLEITSPSGEHFRETAPVKGRVADQTISLVPAVLWDPNSPQLYRLKLTLGSGDDADVVHSYFGLRSLSALALEQPDAPASLCLNGEPIYLRGALYQSYHPEGVYTAGDVEAIQEDIVCAKRAGFDLLRIHLKVDDPLVLYYADTIGMLLMADLPNFGEGGDTALGRRRYEMTMRKTIERDFNHPSIVAWCLFNETWGFGGQVEFVKLINPSPPANRPPGDLQTNGSPPPHQWVQSMWQLAKNLDSTRLVEDMSVVAWNHLQYHGHGDTDVNSWHFYCDKYDSARQQIQEVVEKTYTGSSFNYVPGFQQASQPLINSEYGGVSALDGDVDTSWSFKFLTNELRRHGKLSAYIYTELHDVEWERNGLLNYDRTPKEFGYDPRIVNHGDVLPIDGPPIRRCRAGEDVDVPIYSSHFSRRKRHNVTLHWRLSGLDSVGWMHDNLASGSSVIKFPHLRVELAQCLRLRMPEQTMLCTLWIRALAPDGTFAAQNYVQFLVDAGLPGREENGRRVVLRTEPHSWSTAEWNFGGCSRAEAETRGCSYGIKRGFFEWNFPIAPFDLRNCSRLTLLCEASAFRKGCPQTDSFAEPTALRILLNSVAVYRAILPNHPHDARGALSYLTGGRGAYGYLCQTAIEGALLQQVIAATKGNYVRLRCVVPKDEQPHGGLTVYGSSCGRYPICPTLIVE